MTHTPGARELIDTVLDPGSWRSWDVPAPLPAAEGEYRREVERARLRSGVDEAVITGEGLLSGRRVAFAVSAFAFLGGSIGLVAAERLVRCVERATAEGLPLLAATASGGTRMQEGTVAFVQMVRITEAIRRHRDSHLPYLVYLRHPTTGGVFASWGSLGHVTVAEPGALIGFLGPRVFEALYGEPFPAGVQVAENLHAHGLVDAVLPPEALASVTARALSVMCDRPTVGDPVPVLALPEVVDAPVWDSVGRSRRDDRPGVRRLLRSAATDVVILHGTAEGESDPGLLLALARFGRMPCVVLGQDRRGQAMEGPMGPGALRAARRGMRLAQELDLPLVTVIDTPGAALSRDAEEHGLAGEIARSLHDMLALTVPTLALLLGPGTGGAALALLPADRVVCAQHAWLSPLPPEGASVIVHGSVEQAPLMASLQGVGSAHLLRDGIVDRIIPELPDSADEPAEFVGRVAAVIEVELLGLAALTEGDRLASRHLRFTGPEL